VSTIESMIESFPAAQAKALGGVRAHLRALLPSATEDLSWGMPTFRIEGVIVVSYLGFTHHNSLFPGPEVHELMGSALDNYTTTKGTIHFDRENPPPKSFLAALVKARIKVINAGYPQKSGVFLEFYPNGHLKARGKYKDDAMHGAWEFFRTDGSIMRSGSFNRGSQTGQWTTFTRDGTAHTITQFS
jgi:uncharacterized protein YdhG (YjbR/CyaY superfamily)